MHSFNLANDCKGPDNPLSACAATVNNTVPCHRTTLAKAHMSYPSQKVLPNSPAPPSPILYYHILHYQ